MENTQNLSGRDITPDEYRGALLEQLTKNPKSKVFLALLMLAIFQGAPNYASAQEDDEYTKTTLLPNAIPIQKGKTVNLLVSKSGRTFSFQCLDECDASKMTIETTDGIEKAEISSTGPNGFYLTVKFKKGVEKSQKITLTDSSGQKIIFNANVAKPGEPLATQKSLEALKLLINSAATKADLNAILDERLKGYLTESEFEAFKNTIATAADFNSAKQKFTEEINKLKAENAEIKNELNEEPNEFFEINGQISSDKKGDKKGYGGSAKGGKTLFGRERFDLDATIGFGLNGEELPVKGFKGETTHSMDYSAHIGLEQQIKAVKNWISIVLSEEFVFGEQQRFQTSLPGDFNLHGGISPYVGGKFTGSLMTGFGSKKFQIGAGAGVEISNKREKALGNRGNPDVKWVLEFLKARYRF